MSLHSSTLVSSPPKKMSPKTVESRHAIDSCTFQFHTWRPFLLPNTLKTLDSSDPPHTKRLCLSDRTIETLDMSKLTLFDEDRKKSTQKRDNLRWIARKRRRRASRSVSGRSSDRSGTRRRCCSVGASAAYATCSDFPVAGGTDSSGELFVSGDGNWGSDVSEAAKNVARREKEGERERESGGFGVVGGFEGQGLGNESGYGSEPGYRGDAEFGDEEEDDPRVLFWGDEIEDTDSNMEMVGENTLQKTHHRCRRKKHDLRVVDPLR